MLHPAAAAFARLPRLGAASLRPLRAASVAPGRPGAGLARVQAPLTASAGPGLRRVPSGRPPVPPCRPRSGLSLVGPSAARPPFRRPLPRPGAPRPCRPSAPCSTGLTRRALRSACGPPGPAPLGLRAPLRPGSSDAVGSAWPSSAVLPVGGAPEECASRRCAPEVCAPLRRRRRDAPSVVPGRAGETLLCLLFYSATPRGCSLESGSARRPPDVAGAGGSSV